METPSPGSPWLGEAPWIVAACFLPQVVQEKESEGVHLPLHLAGGGLGGGGQHGEQTSLHGG